jgi:cell wall-associated NlpC family hydrolase
MAPTKQQIVATALTYLDTPFVHQGRSKSGIDCIGLAVCVAHDLGLTEFDETNYERDPDSGRLVELLNEHMDRKPLLLAEPSDLLLMSLSAGRPKHVAIMVDYDMLIHTYYAAGRVVLNTFSNQWLIRVRGCYSFRGVD